MIFQIFCLNLTPIIPLRDDSSQREFPTNALPPILREMVTGIVETTGTDTAMFATSILSTIRLLLYRQI